MSENSLINYLFIYLVFLFSLLEKSFSVVNDLADSPLRARYVFEGGPRLFLKFVASVVVIGIF